MSFTIKTIFTDQTSETLNCSTIYSIIQTHHASVLWLSLTAFFECNMKSAR